MKKCMLFVLSAVLFLSACSKTEYINRVEDGTGGYVLEMYTNETMSTLIGCEFYDEYGKLSMKVVHEYDKNGNCVRIRWTDAEGNVEQTVSIEYDNKGNETVTRWTDAAGIETARMEKDYSAEGIMTECRSYSHGVMDRKSEYEADGMDSTETNYNADGTVAKYVVYEYDQQGYQTARTYTPQWIIQHMIQYTTEGAIEIYYDENGNPLE